jgi:hypothetical protein
LQSLGGGARKNECSYGVVGDETVYCLGDKTESLGGKCLLLTQSKNFEIWNNKLIYNITLD